MKLNQQQNETAGIPENAIVIDLRGEEDYEAGHIPGALRIPSETLREEIRRIARFNTPILLYCHTGRKSEQAAEMLQSRGYENARSIGGTEAYTGPLEPELTIRELREKKGLSQSALARIIGVRQPTVAAYESGKAHPGPAICEAIRRMLFVTIAPPDRTGDSGSRKKAAGSRKSLKRYVSVRELRNELGLTQAAFAQAVGVCTGSVAAYECGRTRPGPRVAEKIRELYRAEINAEDPVRQKALEKACGSGK